MVIPYVRAAVAAAAAAACALSLTVPAAAINSYNDAPAPERTEVGALVAYHDDGDPSTRDVFWLCSGTMIAEDVFLTAAHCTSGAPASVRFGVSLAQDAQGAIDAAYAEGMSDEEVFEAVAVGGTAHTHGEYPGNSSNSYDIAVLTFTPEDAQELASRWEFVPATLPTENLLGELGPRGLRDLEYTVVGYGTEEATREPGGHVHYGGGVRRKAPEGFNALNKTWLRLSMIGAQGHGGACYGDSGGPNFAEIGGELVLVGTTITGDVPCYATNVTYRLDTPTARDFLGQFVTLP